MRATPTFKERLAEKTLNDSPRSNMRRSLRDDGHGDLQGFQGNLQDLKTQLRRASIQKPAGPVTCYERWLAGEYTITPENNFWIDMWDLVVIGALCVTAVLLPWEVALETTTSPYDVWLIDKCIDGIFWVDMVFNFNLAYLSTYHDSNGSHGYEKRPMYIASQYMAFPFSQNFEAGWFWPDILTLIPWELFSTVRGMRSLRLVRVLRLVRMFRLVRVIKLFRRWHTYVGFSFSSVKVVTTLLTTLLLVHWLACLWAHLGQNESAFFDTDDDSLLTWLEFWAGPEIDVKNLNNRKVYTMSLYFTCVVLTAVGFGDITPKADVEYVAMIVTIFVTALTWSWVVANVVKVITDSDIFGNIFSRILDDLNLLMRTRACEKKFTIAVRRHLYAAQGVFRVRHETASIAWLSSALQGELAIDSGIKQSLQNVWYMRDAPETVLICAATYFRGDVFSPDEFIMDPNSVTVVCKGSAAKRGRLLQKDAVFGEDMILASEELKDTACPRTLSFVEVLRLSKEDLFKVCERFPDFDVKVRRAQVRLALWRGFIAQANKIKRLEEKKAATMKGVQNARTSQITFSRDEIVAILNTKDDKKKAVGWAVSMMPNSSYNQQRNVDALEYSIKEMKKSLMARQDMATSFFQSLDHLSEKLEDQQAEMKDDCEQLESRLHDSWKEMQKVQEVIYRCSTRNQVMTSRSNGKLVAR
mmetsp:Transcript_140273/g.244254  ORF Transcript_140273/g.244254 Transcript_140273/m.244254 type:complete len:698 (-) Transcript_140273:67-2160(-)